jgi:two-component system response regulator AtoC
MRVLVRLSKGDASPSFHGAVKSIHGGPGQCEPNSPTAAMFTPAVGGTFLEQSGKVSAPFQQPDGVNMRPQLSWTRSDAMREVAAIVDRVADCDATVLVTGESGVGKEVVARELHRRSGRADRPFIKVNCAAVPTDLLESEMFGHERGAFTGADAATAGKFEAASNGTLMLDEIADMPLALQAKLLHVLDDGQFTKVGGNRQVVTDVRVIAATNRKLPERIADRLFREDLYYRLQVVEIYVPPLRDRREEIESLATAFLAEYVQRNGGESLTLSAAILEGLVGYDWPGNVRELENVIQRYAILRDEARLLAELRNGHQIGSAAAHSAPGVVEPAFGPPDDEEVESLPDRVRRATEAVEREVILRALSLVKWNRRRAAEQLGVSYKTLLNKTKALGLDAGGPELADTEA